MTSWAQVPAQNCAILRNKRRQVCVKGKTTGRTANKSDNERPAHNRRTQDDTYNIAKNNIRTTLTRTMPMDNESYEEIEREAVLGSKKRREFWDTLSRARGFSKEVRDTVLQARPRVNRLCRFRTFGPGSLEQLRTNTLLFSSPPYYDDPLDTYFYVDKKALQIQFNLIIDAFRGHPLKEIIALLGQFGIPDFNKLRDIIGRAEIEELPFQFDQLNSQIDDIRRIVQNVGYSLCFCDDPLNEVLWLKYADNHKGFVQIYDANCSIRFLCGQKNSCGLCANDDSSLAPFPIYYSNEGYDATRYALALLLLCELPANVKVSCPELIKYLKESIRWEFEKVTLIKRKQHEYDCEWRLLCRGSAEGRPSIQMVPSSVVLGLHMKEEEKRSVVDAAKSAGIKEILQAHIDEGTGKLAIRSYQSTEE